MKQTRKKKIEIDLSGPVYILGYGYVAKGSGSAGPFGVMSFSHIKDKNGAVRKKPLGTTISDKDTTGTETRVIFGTVDSVDDLIMDLKKIRTKMAKYDKQMKRALDNAKRRNSVGRINKRRSVSGEDRQR